MQTTLTIGPYAIRIDYDEELAQYAGVVVNRPYRVRLTAATHERLRVRFENLFFSYFGVRSAEPVLP
jgi:hypothetical protein